MSLGLSGGVNTNYGKQQVSFGVTRPELKRLMNFHKMTLHTDKPKVPADKEFYGSLMIGNRDIFHKSASEKRAPMLIVESGHNDEEILGKIAERIKEGDQLFAGVIGKPLAKLITTVY